MLLWVLLAWVVVRVYMDLCAAKDRQRSEHIATFWQMSLWTAMMQMPWSQFTEWWAVLPVDYKPKFLKYRFFVSSVHFPDWRGELTSMWAEAKKHHAQAQQEAFRQAYKSETSVSNLTALNRRNRFRVVTNDEREDR